MVLVVCSLVRNSVVLAVYLLFSVVCFFTVHEHCVGVCHGMPQRHKPVQPDKHDRLQSALWLELCKQRGEDGLRPDCVVYDKAQHNSELHVGGQERHHKGACPSRGRLSIGHWQSSLRIMTCRQSSFTASAIQASLIS